MERTNLKVAMAKKGMNNKDVAEAIDVTPQFISDLRRGTKQGSTKTWLAIAKVLDVTIEEIL
jgi:DNA-binding XRE family transcriptional regulator